MNQKELKTIDAEDITYLKFENVNAIRKKRRINYG